jgi:hypothetical protein
MPTSRAGHRLRKSGKLTLPALQAVLPSSALPDLERTRARGGRTTSSFRRPHGFGPSLRGRRRDFGSSRGRLRRCRRRFGKQVLRLWRDDFVALGAPHGIALPVLAR